MCAIHVLKMDGMAQVIIRRLRAEGKRFVVVVVVIDVAAQRGGARCAVLASMRSSEADRPASQSWNGVILAVVRT